MVTILEPATQFWTCPSCREVQSNTTPLTSSVIHPCPALKGMSVPMVPVDDPDATPDARHIVYNVEDYQGDRISPIAATETVHGDGHTDRIVYTEPAKGRYES